VADGQGSSDPGRGLEQLQGAVQLIVDRPSFAHNTYLQLFAEEGIVGLALFLALVGASLRSAYSAANRFERRGQRDLSTLARAVLVATISMLAAGMFLSAALDQRLWLLLALGPALLTLAEGGARTPGEPAFAGVGGR
jgi:O-antigen ligase